MIMKINCVIVDDEPENLKYLQQIIEDIDAVEIVRSFSDGFSFIEGIKELKFDMCILDNRLPDITGVELAKKLKNIKLIFVSAHDISAYDAFGVNAVDVLKKPVTKERLELAIKKCRDKIINEKGYVFLKTSEGKTRFKLDDIVFIRSEEDSASAYKYIMTKDGEETRTMKITLEKVMKKLPNDRFCFVNRSTILNTLYFKTFGKEDQIFLDFKIKNKQKCLVSSGNYLNDLKQIIGFEIDKTD